MLQRYVVREVVLPFAAWTGLLCVLLFVMAFLKGTEVLLGSAITGWDFARFTLFLLPGFLVQALPISFLLAILLGVGRLVEDGELRAMQALGVAPSVVLRGPVSVSVLVSAGLAFLMSTAQPWGQTMVRLTANEIIRKNLIGDLKPGTFHEEVQGLTLYAGQVDAQGQWKQVLVHDERDPERPLLVLARKGGVRSTEWEDGVNFELDDGVMHRSTVGTDEYAVISYQHLTLRAGVAEAYRQKNQVHTAREEQTPAELIDAADDARAAGLDPRPFEVTLHWRLGQMAMPLAFAFLGAPLAIARRRGGRGWGVLFTLVGYLGYYVLARLAVQLADAGSLSPVLAGQLPNLVFVTVGLLVLRGIVRRGAL